jgi:hypothetical protein
MNFPCPNKLVAGLLRYRAESRHDAQHFHVGAWTFILVTSLQVDDYQRRGKSYSLLLFVYIYLPPFFLIVSIFPLFVSPIIFPLPLPYSPSFTSNISRTPVLPLSLLYLCLLPPFSGVLFRSLLFERAFEENQHFLVVCVFSYISLNQHENNWLMNI